MKKSRSFSFWQFNLDFYIVKRIQSFYYLLANIQCHFAFNSSYFIMQYGTRVCLIDWMTDWLINVLYTAMNTRERHDSNIDWFNVNKRSLLSIELTYQLLSIDFPNQLGFSYRPTSLLLPMTYNLKMLHMKNDVNKESMWKRWIENKRK